MPAPKPTIIYRITHYRNVPWILDHGIHCRTSPEQDPNFVSIGNKDLIDRRNTRAVAIAPGGFLNDYVPFYFAPHSMMLLNIHTGRVEGVKAKQEDIVFLVSSVEKLAEQKVQFIFTDGHAVPWNTEYFTDPADIEKLAWEMILSRDFKKRLDDPDRQRRYQAECLVHRHVPLTALLGIACKDQTRADFLQQAVTERGGTVRMVRKPQWYF